MKNFLNYLISVLKKIIIWTLKSELDKIIQKNNEDIFQKMSYFYQFQPQIQHFLQKELNNHSSLNKKMFYILSNRYHDLFNLEYITETEKKVAYLVISKVACSSLKNSFRSQKVSLTYPHIHHLIYKQPNLHRVHSAKSLKDYTIFTFVRNPYDRLYSTYQSKFITDKKLKIFIYEDYLFGYLKSISSFEEFVRKIVKIPHPICERHFLSQYEIVYKEGKNMIDFVGKFENLEQDFETIRTRFKLKKLEHLNQTSSKKNEWKKHYTKELANLVYYKYKNDFDLWYPSAYQELLNDIEKNN